MAQQKQRKQFILTDSIDFFLLKVSNLHNIYNLNLWLLS